MSYLAIGAVTKAMAELLERKLNKPPLMGATVSLKVTTLPPDDERVDRDNGVNLFLYRVEESPFAKNRDWPGDRANPVGSRHPPLALILHYLLTAYAKKTADAVLDDITAHQILGNALAILHEHPVLNDVHDAEFDSDLDTQFAAELRQSFEKVKITFAPTAVDEFSKIWTGLAKAYRLSVAYEVSLVQIAPLGPPILPGPLVQQLRLQVTALAAPVITSVEPATGPAGAPVTIKGAGFKARGVTTSVTVGDTILAETDLASLTETEITLTLPTALLRGPELRLVVTVGGQESAPAAYRVQPWINAIQPLRGMTGIPLTIPFSVPPGVTVSGEIGGQVAVATPDATGQAVRMTVPDAISTNGPTPVTLILNNGTPQRSNARLFEVLPSIQSVALAPSGPPAKTTVTVTGQRLKGQDVRVRYGHLLFRKGANTSDTEVVVEVARSLPANQPVSVIVDGRASNTLPPRLESIDPPEAFAGEPVTLTGGSLSGQNVVIHFGATDVTLGAQAYSSQLTVAVPAGLPAGTLQVRATVDGQDTNPLPFKALA